MTGKKKGANPDSLAKKMKSLDLWIGVSFTEIDNETKITH